MVEVEVIFKLLIRHKRRDHSHENGRTVVCGLVEPVVLDHFRVLVIATGHDITRGTVVYHQMVGIRTRGGLILGDHSVIDDTQSTFAYAAHTIADCMNSLDNGGGQGGLGAAAILGRHLNLLGCEGVKRSR